MTLRNPKKNLRKESWQRTSGTTKWHKLSQDGVQQVVQGEAGLQIYVEQVEQGEGGLQIVVEQVEQGQGSSFRSMIIMMTAPCTQEVGRSARS